MKMKNLPRGVFIRFNFKANAARSSTPNFETEITAEFAQLSHDLPDLLRINIIETCIQNNRY